MTHADRWPCLLPCLLLACHSVTEPQLAPGGTAADASRPLTHADCVRLACDSAPTQAAWRARHLAALAQLRGAGLLPNPSLSLGWEDFRIVEPVPAAALQQTFTLGMALGDLAARGRRRDIAAHELQAALAALRSEQRQLALEVALAYDELVAARRRAELARAAVMDVRRYRDGLTRLVAAGLEAPFSLAQSEVEQDEANAAVAAADGEARARELAFAFALGFERPVPLRLADDLALALPELDDVEALLAHAAATRPEIAAARARYEAELERLRLVASPLRFLPVVGAGYRLLDGRQSGVASIDVVLPIFDAGGTDVAAQDAAVLAAAVSARSAARDVARDVLAAAQASATAQAFLVQHARPIAQQRSELLAKAQRLFAAGELTFVALHDPVVQAARARQDLLSAELAVAAASWPLRVGALLAELPEPGD